MRSAAPLVLLLLAACTTEPEPAPAPAPATTPVAPAAAATDAGPAPTAAPAGQVLLAFSCRGDDPAWRLHIDGDGRATLRDDDAGDLELVGELEPTAGGYAYRAAPADTPSATYAALVTPGACFVGEGEAARPFTAQLSFADGRQASGCCRGEFGLDVFAAGEFAADTASDWTRDLPELATLVERCALDAGVDTDAVTSVRAADGGKFVVSLRDSDEARFDCLIDADGGDIEAVNPASGEAPAITSEWLPSDPDALPRLDCGQVFRDSAGDGQPRGWVHVRTGCDAR